MAPSRRRSTLVTIGAAALVASSLTACASDFDEYGSDDADYAGVCVDKATQKRVQDRECATGSAGAARGGYGWYYIPHTMVAPPVGGTVRSGSYTAPAGHTVTRGVSPKGGTFSNKGMGGGYSSKGGSVSRGGFGGKGGGSVGG